MVRIYMLAGKNIAGELRAKRTVCHQGFTLLEVLVAMAVMIVIIVMVTNMFRDASEAWDSGTQRAEMNTSARAAVEYITRELQSAIAGPIDTVASPAAAYLPFRLDSDGLKFCTLTQTPGGNARAMRGVLFYHVPLEARLMYKRLSTTFTGYQAIWDTDQSPPPAPDLLITNVWRFEVTIYSNENDMISGSPATLPYNSSVLPAAVDISIEMLGERDMARALSLSGAAQEGYVMTNSRVYTARVCFPNRGGGR